MTTAMKYIYYYMILVAPLLFASCSIGVELEPERTENTSAVAANVATDASQSAGGTVTQ